MMSLESTEIIEDNFEIVIDTDKEEEFSPSIISINMNGFSMEKVYELTDELSEPKNEKIKIILLQHIDINKKENRKHIYQLFHKVGFVIILHCRHKGKGTAIAYNLKYFKAHKILYKDDDFRMNSILLYSGNTHIAVASIYGVPNQIKEQNKKFAADFNTLMQKINHIFEELKEPPLLIIGGDTNTIWCNDDYLSNQTEGPIRPYDYMFNDIVIETQLIDTYLKQDILSIPRFTHNTETSAARLDKIYTNCLMLTKSHKTIHATFGMVQTDHLAVQCNCDIPVEPFVISTNNMMGKTFYNQNDINKLNGKEKQILTNQIEKEINNMAQIQIPLENQIDHLNEIIKSALESSKANKESLPFGFEKSNKTKKKYYSRRLDKEKEIKNKILSIKSKLYNLINIKKNNKQKESKIVKFINEIKQIITSHFQSNINANKINKGNIFEQINKILKHSSNRIKSQRKKIIKKYYNKIELTLLYKKYSKEYYNILRTNKSAPSLTSLMNKDGITINTHSEVANEAKENYQNIYRKPEFKDTKLDWRNEKLFEDVIENEEMEIKILFEIITLENYITTIKDLPNGKSPGMDGIPYEILKLLPTNANEIIIKQMNKILEGGYLPDIWSNGLMKLLFKGNDADPFEVNSYRPITLMCCMYKVFTNILTKRMNKIIHLQNKLSDSQGGFRPLRNCANKFTQIYLAIQNAKLHKKEIHLLLIDIAKAFDSIPFETILDNLQLLKFSSKTINLIKILFTNVKTNIQIQQTLSEQVILYRGVKQGDPLSPLLFNIYLEPVLQLIKMQKEKYNFANANKASFQSGAFADDMAIAANSNEEINKLFRIIEEYLTATDVKLNHNKCEYVTNNIANNQSIKSLIPSKSIANRGIKHCFKYLGVYLNLELSFNAHQKHVIDKINPIIKKLSNLPLNCFQMANAINVMIIPILTYGAEVVNYKQNFLMEIDSKLRKLVKMGAKFPRCTQTNFIYAAQKKGGLGVNKLLDRIDAIRISFWYKSFVGKRDINLNQILENLLLIEHARAKTNSLFTSLDINMKENNWIKQVYESSQRCKLIIKIKNIPQFDDILLQSLAPKTLMAIANKEIFSISKFRVGPNIIKKSTFKNKYNIKLSEPEREALKNNLKLQNQNLNIKEEEEEEETVIFNGILHNVEINFQTSNKQFKINNNKFANQSEIEIYTDGSVFQDTKRAAYSIYSRNTPNMVEVGRVKGKLDSYRAEGYGIYRAIKICNKESNLHIFTDSKSMIDGINRKIIDIRSNPTKDEPEVYAQEAAGDLISAIINLKLNRLGATLITYVKGHSGIIGNEIANDLAKWAALNLSDEMVPSIDESKLEAITIYDKSNTQINQAITPLISKLKKLEYYEEWHKMKLAPVQYADVKLNNLNNLTLKKNLIHFAIKCRTNQLPCLRTLYRRDGITDQCMLCDQVIENIPHVMSCINEADPINLELCKNIHKLLIKTIVQNNLNLNFKWPFGKITQLNNCTSIYNQAIEEEWKSEIDSSAYCIIPPTMNIILKTQYHIEDSKILTKINKEILILVIEARFKIWTHRNKKMVQLHPLFMSRNSQYYTKEKKQKKKKFNNLIIGYTDEVLNAKVKFNKDKREEEDFYIPYSDCLRNNEEKLEWEKNNNKIEENINTENRNIETIEILENLSLKENLNKLEKEIINLKRKQNKIEGINETQKVKKQKQNTNKPTIDEQSDTINKMVEDENQIIIYFEDLNNPNFKRKNTLPIEEEPKFKKIKIK